MSKQKEYIQWLKNKFQKDAPLPAESEEANYFSLGLIDSYSFVELVADIEKEFKVKFTIKHFKDPKFFTIKGLAEMIDELTLIKTPTA